MLRSILSKYRDIRVSKVVELLVIFFYLSLSYHTK